MNILVVDDNQQVLNSTSSILEEEGHKVFWAKEGREALEVAGEERIELLLTDLKMHGMNGLELIAQTLKLYPDMPIIVMSGLFSRGFRFQMESKYNIKLLVKPFLPDELRELVNEQIELKEKGITPQFNLAAFLDLISYEQMNMLVSLKQENNTGVLYVKDGMIIDGLSKEKKGNRAIDDMMEWKGSVISVSDIPSDKGKSVKSVLNRKFIEDSFWIEEKEDSGSFRAFDYANKLPAAQMVEKSQASVPSLRMSKDERLSANSNETQRLPIIHESKVIDEEALQEIGTKESNSRRSIMDTGMIKSIMGIPGIVGVVISDSDGEALDYEGSQFDSEELASSMSFLSNGISSIGERLGLEMLLTVWVEGMENGIALTTTDDSFVITLIKQGKFKRTVKKLHEII